MRKLIAILICISTLAFLSCSDNPSNGTQNNGNDNGNTNGNDNGNGGLQPDPAAYPFFRRESFEVLSLRREYVNDYGNVCNWWQEVTPSDTAGKHWSHQAIERYTSMFTLAEADSKWERITTIVALNIKPNVESSIAKEDFIREFHDVLNVTYYGKFNANGHIVMVTTGIVNALAYGETCKPRSNFSIEMTNVEEIADFLYTRSEGAPIQIMQRKVLVMSGELKHRSMQDIVEYVGSQGFLQVFTIERILRHGATFMQEEVHVIALRDNIVYVLTDI